MGLYRRALCLFLLACTIPLRLHSQTINMGAGSGNEKWGVSYYATGGYVWAHKGPVYNIKAHVYGGRVAFRYKTAGRQQWQRIFNNPAWGVQYLYLYFGNPNILGSVHALVPYMEFPLAKIKRWDLSLAAATGLGYITKPFNLENNTTNHTIGSHLNGHMGLHLSVNCRISENTELNLMGGISHFSNGNFKMPNLGVNIPDGNIGLTHYWGRREVKQIRPDDIDSSKDEYRISAAFAQKYTDYIFPHKVTVGIMQFKYLRAVSLKNKLGGGFDFAYDPGNRYIDNKTGAAKKNTFEGNFEAGIKISHELHGKRLGLITDVGVYLYNKNYVKGLIYQKVGLLCNISRHFDVYTALKVHFARADYFEWGINYKIRKN